VARRGPASSDRDLEIRGNNNDAAIVKPTATKESNAKPDPIDS
jgi:hypothetical protein